MAFSAVNTLLDQSKFAKKRRTIEVFFFQPLSSSCKADAWRSPSTRSDDRRRLSSVLCRRRCSTAATQSASVPRFRLCRGHREEFQLLRNRTICYQPRKQMWKKLVLRCNVVFWGLKPREVHQKVVNKCKIFWYYNIVFWDDFFRRYMLWCCTQKNKFRTFIFYYNEFK